MLLSHTHAAAAAVNTPDFLLYRPVGVSAPANTTSPTGLSPAQVRKAYGFDQTMFGSAFGDGTGQTIAIVDAYNDPNLAADLSMFDQHYGLSAPASFKIVGQTGTTRLPGVDPAGRGNSWAMETSLDVEWAHAMAPNASILVVEANSASNADLFAAVDTARKYAGVSVVSMSWGGAETLGMSSYDSHFTTPSGHIGVTFVASSGDSGAYDVNSTSKTVEYPAASPNVLSVGGTYLRVDASGNYISETGWGNGTRSGTSGGSGGGVSAYAAQPAYQRGVVTQSTAKRAVPDVAMDADPASGVSVYDSYDDPSAPWVTLGGTSMAAPMWAAVIAIADQGRVLQGLGTLDGATGTLPDIYKLPAKDFHDIVSGNNGYGASAGYDLVTGRGSPIVNLLALDLAGYAGASTQTGQPTVGLLTVSQPTVTEGGSVILTASSVQSATGTTVGKVSFYRESNAAIGLQTGIDTYLGDGVLSAGLWTLTTSTAGLAPGDYVYYAVATDSKGVVGGASLAALTVLAPAPGNDAFAAAQTITGTSATMTGTNVNATRQAGEPYITGNVGGRSVWYTWTAPSSGRVTIDTGGSNFDTMLGVYTGNTVNALTLVAGNDDANRYTTLSQLAFNAVKGVTYRIAVDGYNGASGNIQLNLAEAVAPANDSFSAAAVLSGSTLTWTGTNVSATREAGEPIHAGNTGGSSIWFTWTAPTTGTVTINTRGSGFDTLLAVYTGNSVSGLTAVASNDDASYPVDLTSAVTFHVVAGQTYRIAVDGWNGAAGNVVLNLAMA